LPGLAYINHPLRISSAFSIFSPHQRPPFPSSWSSGKDIVRQVISPAAFLSNFNASTTATITKMPGKELVYNWYIALLAAGCMVLMGYDASVFNSVQVSPNWKKHFNYPVRLLSSLCCKEEADRILSPQDPNMIGLINTTYTVGGIICGWFFSGPIVSLFGEGCFGYSCLKRL